MLILELGEVVNVLVDDDEQVVLVLCCCTSFMENTFDMVAVVTAGKRLVRKELTTMMGISGRGSRRPQEKKLVDGASVRVEGGENVKKEKKNKKEAGDDDITFFVPEPAAIHAFHMRAQNLRHDFSRPFFSFSFPPNRRASPLNRTEAPPRQSIPGNPFQPKIPIASSPLAPAALMKPYAFLLSPEIPSAIPAGKCSLLTP